MNDTAALEATTASLSSTITNTLPTVYKKLQSVVDSGTIATNTFVSRITQDTQGKVTITKGTVDFSDYYTKTETASNFKSKQTAVTDPAVNGATLDFISNISQDVQGVITPTKKTVDLSKITGNIDDIETDISQIRAILGHSSGGLLSGESNHHAQLESLATRVGTLDSGKKNKQSAINVGTDDKNTFITRIAQDANGDITGTTTKTVDFSAYQPKGDYKIKQAAVVTPTASNNETQFIDVIEQDSNGNISKITKKNISVPAMNYLGTYSSAPSAGLGDIATIGGTLKRYNGSSWETFEGLSKKLYYLDGTESGVFYFTDKSDNVVAYVDANGISTTDITLNSLKKGTDGVWSVITSGTVNGNTQLAETLKDALNNITALKTNVGELSSGKKNLQTPVQQATSKTGSTTSFVDLITQNDQGVISYTTKTVDFSDYLRKTDAATTYKPIQTAVDDPTASGTSTSFIASISQDANGKITVTKKNLASYKTTQTAVSSPNTNGSTLEFIDTISQNTNGVITATKKSVDFTSINTSIASLQTWQDNWNAKASVDIEDKIYFVDSQDNVIAYFDNDGLTVTNINLRTPNVPSGGTANATGQSTASMIFFWSKGTITVNNSFL